MFSPDEDPDLNIYFNPVTLMEYLANLEEDNLFKINLVQEDEQALDNEKKKILDNIKNKEEEIAEVLKNIESLEQSKEVLLEK
jgi:NAD+--asparagine ADP-ribosyltransferase